MIEVDDPAAEQVEPALRVERLKVIFKGDLHASNADIPHICDCPPDKPGAEPGMAVVWVHHQIEEKRIGEAVAQHRCIPDELTV